MKIKLVSDGRVLQGTPRQIVEAMRSLAFGHEGRPLGEYIDWAAGEAARLMEIDLEVEGETDDERCASLLEAMEEAGLAESMR
jgi:hypothetical protein